MGQSFSSGNKIVIYIDKPYYSPGDAISGQVLLNCTQPFKSTALVLKIEGYEAASWEERREDKTYDSEREEWVSRDDTRLNSGKRQFFSVKVPLSTYAQQVVPGQYQFPFGCILPMGLPGSFEFTGNNIYSNGYYNNYVKAKIRYKVKAECEVPGMLKPNLRGKVHVVVHERMSKMPSQVVVEDRQSITTCCCCGQGNASISARVEKDSYLPGETANVLLQVSNDSSVDFSTISLSLHRTISLRSDGAGYLEYNEELTKVSLPGVRPGERLDSPGRALALQLPQGLQSSASGMVVQCQYTLEVELKGSTFTSNPKVKLPVMIYQTPPPFQAYTSPPPFWTPELVAPAVQVELPSAPPLPPGAQVMSADAQGTYVPPQPTWQGGPPPAMK